MTAQEVESHNRGPRHRGPSLLVVAIVFTLLFVGSLVVTAAMTHGGHFPSPFDPPENASGFFAQHADALRISAFLQLGAATPLAIFAATASSRLRFLGVQAAGSTIALLGGALASGMVALSGLTQWILAQPGVAASDAGHPLHLLAFATGGPGFVGPFGILVAGVSVTGGLARHLPRWLMWFGLVVAAIAELSSLSLVVPGAMYLLPLARFPGLVWLIAVGATLSSTRRRREQPTFPAWSLAFGVSLLFGSIGCVDEPHPVPNIESSVPAEKLSQVGVFIGNPALQIPAAGFVPYEVNVSLYSDGATKRRFVRVPPGNVIHVTEDRWDIPVGTYFVKTFSELDDRRDPSKGERLIETRILVREADRLTVSTYLWNDAQTDANVSGGNVDVPTHFIDLNGEARSDHFHVPGTSQCESCHDDRALGWRTRQMDHTGPMEGGSGDQIARLLALGVIDAAPMVRDPLADPFGDAPLDARARSYLDANCSHCHAKTGGAAGTGLFWDREDTTEARLPICRPTTDVAGRDRVLVPGHPDQSEFLARMVATDPFLRMPQGPTHIPDSAGIDVLSDWVSSMPARRCP